MSVPLFVSERSKPKITTQPLSVGCLIFERMDQIDFTGPLKFFHACQIHRSRSSGKKLRRCVTCRGFDFGQM
jgi:hypothetical protein